MLESMIGIAYARSVIPNEPIRPLQDVWLRPRRVFRELASQPIGLVDHLLGAAQGIVSMLGYCRATDFGAKFALGEIFWTAGLTGSVFGIASLYIMAAIYARLGSRAGGTPTRRQAVHVLAYGGVPMAVSLGIWLLTALLAGEVAFVQDPKEVEDFIGVLLTLQFAELCAARHVERVLQVMGFSEVFGISNVKAFGIWVLGQLIAVLVGLISSICLTAQLIPPERADAAAAGPAPGGPAARACALITPRRPAFDLRRGTGLRRGSAGRSGGGRRGRPDSSFSMRRITRARHGGGRLPAHRRRLGVLPCGEASRQAARGAAAVLAAGGRRRCARVPWHRSPLAFLRAAFAAFLASFASLRKALSSALASRTRAFASVAVLSARSAAAPRFRAAALRWAARADRWGHDALHSI